MGYLIAVVGAFVCKIGGSLGFSAARELPKPMRVGDITNGEGLRDD